jgi:hypothetical protein
VRRDGDESRGARVESGKNRCAQRGKRSAMAVRACNDAVSPNRFSEAPTPDAIDKRNVYRRLFTQRAQELRNDTHVTHAHFIYHGFARPDSGRRAAGLNGHAACTTAQYAPAGMPAQVAKSRMETAMATKAAQNASSNGTPRPGRWWRRWVITCLVWAVPVVALGVKEMVAEMLYDSADIQVSLDRWVLTDAQRAMPAADHCTGTLDAARQTGCPAPILASNTALRDAAINELHVRRMSQITGFLQALFVYWVIPCAFILGVGLVCGVIRRALRRPPPALAAGQIGQPGASVERPRS